MSLRSTFSAWFLVVIIASALPAPHIVFAASPCTLEALDTVAGLGTQVTLRGCAPSESLSVTIDGPGGERTSLVTITDASGGGVAQVAAHATERAGSYEVSAGGAITSFTVLPDRADDTRSSVVALPAVLPTPGTMTVRALLRDRYDNPISRRPLALMGNRPSDVITPRSVETDDGGMASWTVQLSSAGAAVFTPYDLISSRPLALSAVASVGTASPTIPLAASLTGWEQGNEDTTANVGAFVAGFCISWPQSSQSQKDPSTTTPLRFVAPPSVPQNELFSLSIVAVSDLSACSKEAAAEGRPLPIVRNYIGTLVVESTDGGASLPKKGSDPSSPNTGLIEFRNFDQGVRLVPQSFLLRSGGPQTISVYDRQDSSLQGSITLNDVTGTVIQIESPREGQRIARTQSLLVQGRAPSLWPLTIRNGTTVVQGAADSQGIFRIEVPIPADRNEMTLYVDAGQGTETATVSVIIDALPPAITTASIDPERGRTEENATLRVVSEPELRELIATVDSVQSTLSALPDSPGTYEGTIRAPKTPGTFDVSLRATDAVGNTSTLLVKWTVLPRDVPRVTGVSATEEQGHIRLQWAPVTGVDVAEYRMYIARAQEPMNILYSLGTGKPLTSAIIQDLPRGASYVISLTVRTTDGVESATRSDPVKISIPGLVLRASSSQGGLLLQWDPIQDLPLSHYVLELGTEAGAYPVQRTIDGTASSTVVRDLIEGITYEFRLTPVDVTGKSLPHLAAVTRHIAGPASSIAEPAPDSLLSPLHPGADLTPRPELRDVPSVASTGISSLALGLGLILATIVSLLFWHRRRERQHTAAYLRSLARHTS